MAKRTSSYVITGTEGVELACSSCPVVLVLGYNPGDDFPRHRCSDGRAADFDVINYTEEPVEDSKRTDKYWYGEYSHRSY